MGYVLVFIAIMLINVEIHRILTAVHKKAFFKSPPCLLAHLVY